MGTADVTTDGTAIVRSHERSGSRSVDYSFGTEPSVPLLE